MKMQYWKRMEPIRLNHTLWKSFQRIVLSFFIVCFVLPALFAQNADTVSNVNPNRLKIVVIGSTVAYTGAMVGLSYVWYSNYDRQDFHFFNDAGEWKQMDKAGHFYSAFQLSSIGSHSLQWSGVSKKKSDWIGALSGFVVMSSIEVLDGFSAGYGASATDLAANALGAGFYLGQQALWKQIKIYPKFSFHQTDYAAQRPEALGATFFQQIIKDYNGQTYWLSVDMDKFLKFPKWLNFSVGYGAEDMLYANDSDNLQNNLNPYRQFYFGLDFDLTAIKSRSKFVNGLIYFANMVKLPAPTLEISNGKVKGYFFYY